MEIFTFILGFLLAGLLAGLAGLFLLRNHFVQYRLPGQDFGIDWVYLADRLRLPMEVSTDESMTREVMIAAMGSYIKMAKVIGSYEPEDVSPELDEAVMISLNMRSFLENMTSATPNPLIYRPSPELAAILGGMQGRDWVEELSRERDKYVTIAKARTTEVGIVNQINAKLEDVLNDERQKMPAMFDDLKNQLNEYRASLDALAEARATANADTNKITELEGKVTAAENAAKAAEQKVVDAYKNIHDEAFKMLRDLRGQLKKQPNNDNGNNRNRNRRTGTDGGEGTN